MARSRNEFRGNDFRSAEIIDCRFWFGVDIGAQSWPDDPIYLRLDRWPERVAAARSRVAVWPEGPEKEYAEDLLMSLGDYGMAEQEEAFLRRDDVRRIPAVRDRLYELLQTAV